MKLSVVIATYNRRAILEKCLRALLTQTGVTEPWEIVVIDDGSTDGSGEMIAALRAEAPASPSWQYHAQANAGRSRARNLGIEVALGELVVFIDSDVVVVPGFIAEHLSLHRRHAGKKVFVQGLAVDTDRFDDPLSTPVGPTARSAAFFATNNVSVPRAFLQEVGGFDENFTEYGWEDLELGLRLKAIGVGIVRTREARGFHWHPAFSLADLPGLRRIEEQRGRMGAYFYRKHPTLEVRLMIQLTALHQGLAWITTLGGWLTEERARPALQWLVERGRPGAAKLLAQLVLNQANLQQLHLALARGNQAAVRG